MPEECKLVYEITRWLYLIGGSIIGGLLGGAYAYVRITRKVDLIIKSTTHVKTAYIQGSYDGLGWFDINSKDEDEYNYIRRGTK